MKRVKARLLDGKGEIAPGIEGVILGALGVGALAGANAAELLERLLNKYNFPLQGRLDWAAIACYKMAINLNPNWVEAHRKLCNVLEQQGRHKEVIESYLNLGNVLGKQGKHKEASDSYQRGAYLKTLTMQHGLNDEFNREILNLVETPELRSMILNLAKAPALYHPSKFWIWTMTLNIVQLEKAGIENFKRTVNQNYFNWITGEVVAQLQTLKNELCLSDSEVEKLDTSMSVPLTAIPPDWTKSQYKEYTQFLCMLWDFASSRDQMQLLNQLQEPLLGNPIGVKYKELNISQDICNSVIEINAAMDAIKLESNGKIRVAELGAGYGRIAYVLLQTIKDIQVVIIDIPPALYVSQWYLSRLFPEKPIFKYREFSSYHEVQQDFESSSIAFLLPHQIEYLPESIFDMFINISSLHEMNPAQIDMWFSHIDRVCRGWFYTKQFVEHQNDFDRIVIRREDYPVRNHWKELFNRSHPVQKRFFEALYKVQ